MHWKFTTGSPVTDCVVVDTEVLGSLCGVKVFRQFGHGFRLDSLGAIFHQGTNLTNPTKFYHHRTTISDSWLSTGNHAISREIAVRECTNGSESLTPGGTVAEAYFRPNAGKTSDVLESQTKDLRRSTLHTVTSSQFEQIVWAAGVYTVVTRRGAVGIDSWPTSCRSQKQQRHN